MPTYESDPAYLKAAIECVLNQTHQDWTLMMRDDASTSDVHALVAPFLADPRITFVRNNERKGIGGNWNACLESADRSGNPEYIQFFFQDDLWEPNYLEKSVQALEANNADFSFADHEYLLQGEEEFKKAVEHIYTNLAKAKERVAAGKHSARAFLNMWIRSGLRTNIIGEPCFVMLRKSLVDRTGPVDMDLRQVLDSEYWLRCLQKASSVVYIKESLGTFRVHAKAASARNNVAKKRRRERLLFLRKHPILALRGVLKI
jgi:glycosyltransferase involved in cell wall biosynthesis